MNTTKTDLDPKWLTVTYWLTILVCVAITLFAFTGCSVLKKHKTITKTTIDSTATISTTSKHQATVDSNTIVINKETGTKIAESTWEKETVIEDYAVIGAPYASPGIDGSGQQVAAPAIDGMGQHVPAFRQLDTNDIPLLGGHLLAHTPIIVRKTTIKERGTTTEKYDFILDHSQITDFNKEEEATIAENATVEVKKKEATKTKDGEKKTTPIALLVGFVVLMLYLGWRRWKNKIKETAAGFITGV